MSEDQKGQVTIEQRKKKREIFEERGHHVEVPQDVGDQEKRALAQKGEDSTAGWGS